MSLTASFTIVAAPRRSIAPVFLYSPLTAADEKIPLSVVRVNNKPQHLVFWSHFGHLLSKHRHLPVESRKWPCLARCRAVCVALESGQNSCPRPLLVPLSKGSPSPASSQGAGLVQNRATPVRIVDIGDVSRGDFGLLGISSRGTAEKAALVQARRALRFEGNSPSPCAQGFAEAVIGLDDPVKPEGTDIHWRLNHDVLRARLCQSASLPTASFWLRPVACVNEVG